MTRYGREFVRRVAIVACTLSLACAGPKLREPKKLKPKKVSANCHVEEGNNVSRDQALCIARLAGLNVAEGQFTIREARSLQREAVWIVEELCGELNPRCIGIAIRQADGTLANTRYLYVFEDR